MNVRAILGEFSERQGIKSAEWYRLLDQVDEYLHKLEYQLSQSVPVESSLVQYYEVKKLQAELQKTREQLEVAEAVLSVQCTNSALAYFKDKQGEE